MDFVRHVRHANINAGIIVDTILLCSYEGILFGEDKLRKR